MSVVAYEPCRYVKRWSELWASLPDDRERQILTNTLANGRLEGMEPTREFVADLVAEARGELTFDEARARTLARARARAAARDGAAQ